MWSVIKPFSKTFEIQQANIADIDISPDGKSIVTVSKDAVVKLWSINGTLLDTFQSHQAGISSVAFAPDGKKILTGSKDATAKLWNISGLLLQSFESRAPISRVDFSSSGKTILTVQEEEKSVNWWSIDGRFLFSFMYIPTFLSINAVPLPDEKRILIANTNKDIFLWDRDNLSSDLEISNMHSDDILSVTISPDGKTILTGSKDKTAKLWSIDGKLLTTFYGHQSDIFSVAFSPSGKAILTASKDKTAKLWSSDGRILHTFQGFRSDISRVAFLSDGETILITENSNKTIQLLDFNLNELLGSTCNRLKELTSSNSEPDFGAQRDRVRRACEGIPLLKNDTVRDRDSTQQKSSWLEQLGQFFKFFMSKS